MNLASALSPSRWLSTTQPVDRASYFATGVFLMAVKYALEAAIVFGTCRVLWPPWVFLSPVAALRAAALGSVDSDSSTFVLATLGVLSLPFLAIGLSMSVRRAADAGLTPWLGLAFVVPGINYLAMLALAIAPSKPAAPTTRAALMPENAGAVRDALIGVVAATTIGVGVVLVASNQLEHYGLTIFFLLPVSMGAVGGYLLNRDRDRGIGLTLVTGLVATFVTGGAILLFALEGIVCVLMAAPIAIVAVSVGAQIGRMIAMMVVAKTGRPGASGAGPTFACIALLPVLASFESAVTPATVYEVSSSVVVDATPDEVWRRVISFPDLPSAHEWYFRTGIAVPLRARIEGEGVGAVRHCEFSTGAFVEPVTVWEPGRRLGFDVVSQPPPLDEWSVYGKLHPPHLEATLRSVRGEFRIIALADGRSRLEGSTWYTLTLGPELYFRLWSDAIIHRVHLRVLEHVRTLAEADARGGA